MSFVKTWDESDPAGASLIRAGDDSIRNFKYALRERLAVEHRFYPDESGQTNIGAHDQLTLITRTAPAALADAIRFFGKDVGGKCEGHWVDEDANEVQLTGKGKIFGDNVRLSNNVNLVAKDAAGTGTVNLIKANASDEVETGAVTKLPDASKLATSAAPTTDAQIANKKYVDDKVGAIPAQVGLGAWLSRSANTAYLAATDGFVQAYTTAYYDGWLYAYTDANSNPTTVRDQMRGTAAGNGSSVSVRTVVRKGDYWKVSAAADKVWWIPLGS